MSPITMVAGPGSPRHANFLRARLRKFQQDGPAMPKRSFISNRDGRWELFKQVLGGKTVEQLATAVWEDEAPFTPDGRWFLYLDSSSNRATSTPAKLFRILSAWGRSKKKGGERDFSEIRTALLARYHSDGEGSPRFRNDK